MSVSVLIPAHDEAEYIRHCLDALLRSDIAGVETEVIVIANGCTDDTADIARGYAGDARKRGWGWTVLELPEGNKLAAWNAGEVAARGESLVYLDADVRVSAPLLGQIAAALRTGSPRYASGQPNVTLSGRDGLTRLYTRFWRTTPFMRRGVPGFGLFAMNTAGRARWGTWPDIISDDTFARLNFRPEERSAVPASYDWPMVEGFRRLVRVRRRQDAGVAEIAARYPALLANDDLPGRGAPLWQRALRDPVAFAAYAGVRGATRLPILRSEARWARGR